MQILLIVGGLMIGLLVLATAVKFYEVHKATNWRSVPGKVLASKSVARRVRTAESHARAEQGGDLTLRNFAEVRYEYRVDGKRYTGDRVSLGEDLGNFQVAETLARYPVGATVTVYYDPAKPTQAVLERDAPPGVFRTLGIFIAVLVALFAAFVIGVEPLVAALGRVVSRPEVAALVAGFGGLGIFLVLIAEALRRQLRDAASWPSISGVVETSGIERFRAYDRVGVNIRRRRWLYRPDVEYAYRVDGVEYRGNRISFGGRLYATFDWLARRRVEPYGEGDEVVVRYNPENPAEAVLELRSYGIWAVWLLAAGFIAAAIRFAAG
jgi:hypothetical protein